MTYKPNAYENSNIGSMEYSILELLLKNNNLFADLKLTSDMFFDDNIRKIIEFANEQNVFDTNDIIAESKINKDFVSHQFVDNMLFRDNDFEYNFYHYQPALLENYKAFKINELRQMPVNTNAEINEYKKQIEYYNDLTLDEPERTQEISKQASENVQDKDPYRNVVRTGYSKLDNAIGGFKLQTLSIIGANPSMGKTAFALNLMWNILKSGYDVTFFSLEMTGVDVFYRLASRVKAIPSQKIRDRSLSDEELDGVLNLFNVLGNSKHFHVNDGSNITTREIRAAAAKESDVQKVIFIDHLSFIKSQNEKADLRVKIAETSRELTAIAKEYNVAIVCLAQLNRANKQRQDKRPEMSDLQESGNIEQDANTILMLHRDDYHDVDKMNSDKSDTQVLIRKNRDGNMGTIDMTFHKGVQTFYEN